MKPETPTPGRGAQFFRKIAERLAKKIAQRAARQATKKAARKAAAPVKLNVLFIGGSNTMLKKGYFHQTVKRLSASFELGKVDNYAVGNTTMGMGLWQVLRAEDLASYDAIFIEYCVNDYLFVRSPEMYAYWQWLVENVLHQIRSVNTNADIYPLLFGRRGNYSCPKQRAMFDYVRSISSKYQARPIPIDELLHAQLADPEQDGDIYSDGAHYARPDITMQIAKRITTKVRERIRTPGRGLPVASRNIQYRDHTFFASLGESRRFTNSKYDFVAIGIEADGPWLEMTVPGELIQLNYIATQNSARLIVAEEGGEVVAIDTLHSDTDAGRFSFLIQNLEFCWKAPPALDGKPRKLALRVVSSPAAIEGVRCIEMPQMLPPRDAETNNIVYLFGALFG